jgi:hypothetical protein
MANSNSSAGIPVRERTTKNGHRCIKISTVCSELTTDTSIMLEGKELAGAIQVPFENVNRS